MGAGFLFRAPLPIEPFEEVLFVACSRKLIASHVAAASAFAVFDSPLDQPSFRPAGLEAPNGLLRVALDPGLFFATVASLEISGAGSQRAEAEVDVTLVAVTDPQAAKLRPLRISTIPIERLVPERGGREVVVAHAVQASSGLKSLVFGTVLMYNSHFFVDSARVAAPVAGCPVLDAAGALVGFQTEQGNTSLHMAPFLDSLRRLPAIDPAHPPPAPSPRSPRAPRRTASGEADDSSGRSASSEVSGSRGSLEREREGGGGGSGEVTVFFDSGALGRLPGDGRPPKRAPRFHYSPFCRSSDPLDKATASEADALQMRLKPCRHCRPVTDKGTIHEETRLIRRIFGGFKGGSSHASRAVPPPLFGPTANGVTRVEPGTSIIPEPASSPRS